MTKWSVAALALFAAPLLAAGPATTPAPGTGRMGGWGPNGAYCRMWNAQEKTTIKGVVTKVDEVVPLRGMSKGVVLQVQIDGETMPVHLGPSWFIDRQEMTFAPKDEVEVTGSKITFDGKPAILAQTVTKGGATLTLRDENGMPLWAPMRHGRGMMMMQGG